MSDYASSLPVRTENDGDVVVKVGDGTVPSQQLAIDAAGKPTVKLDDTDGNGITSQANGAQQALDVGINVAGVQIDPRDIRALTNTDVVTAEQGTSPWVSQVTNLPTTVDTNFGAVGASTLRSAAQIGNATGAADFNFGAVGAQTLRAASQIGNATGAADFNNGATGAQTVRVAANLAVAGANVSATNPVPVTIEDAPGTHVNDYKDASAIAAAASDNHDYAVTVGKTLHLNQIEASASGKAKMVVQVETALASGIFTTYWTQFNSTANPNMNVQLQNNIQVAAGVKVRVVMTNKDNQAQDLYSTISGYEL